ncbi:MAG: hypothetical protein IIZ38_13310 [Sphingomonas sp.]|uniref:hypothetical protein n=1 Tax=Sphingomonas sp. TaxID=28214 RepID=UPI0025F8740D|nr:hypothetical protein [Sphingomonas sp.]MBQ1499285.1 hypothetical protein [Sphingomonas sp.]
MLFLLPSLLAVVGISPLDDGLLCTSEYVEGSRLGIVTLTVDAAYKPVSMRLMLLESPRQFSAEIHLDPERRALPGVLTGAFFGVRLARKPRLPLTMRVYADGSQRWQRRVDELWAPPQPGDPEMRPFPGHADHIGQADDGLPVTTPHALHVTLADAGGKLVGEEHFALSDTKTSEALATVEDHLRARKCYAPPPLID